jgi:glycosyltransferase involved in cell wall biosynthesis
MKILMINHYAVPPIESGGTRHYSLAQELIKRGHQVTVIAANFSHQKRVPLIPDVREPVFERHYDEVPFIWVNVPPYTRNSPARAKNMIAFTKAMLINKYFKEMDPPDVVIGSSPHPFAAWAAQILAKRWGTPFVFEIRDLWPQSLIDLGRISPKHPLVWFLAKLEKYLLYKAERILTLLPGADKYIESVGINTGKIIWLPNGIDFDIFARVEPKEQDEIFSVMYAGNHGLGNGIETIVNCAEIVQKAGYPSIMFRIIGDGPQKNNLIKMATDKNLNNIRFEDPVSKQKIPSTLSQADTFILCMKDSPVFRWGISPNKLYDYLCSARPIIFAVNAYNNPVDEAGAGITIPPDNPEEMAAAVIKLYQMNSGERKRMGINGRKYVEKNHDFRNLAIKLEETLADTIVHYYE